MKEKIRVLHLTNRLSQGGIETWLLNISRELENKKVHFDFCVIDSGKGVYCEELEELGSKIFYIDGKIHKNIWKVRGILRGLVTRGNYHFIHGHKWHYNSLYSYYLKGLGVKFISHSHTAKRPERIIERILKYFDRKSADYYLACSDLAKKTAFGRIKLCPIIHYGINTKRFKPNRKQTDIVNLGSVGRFVPVKNHKFIIEIANEIKRRSLSKYRFILIGDGLLKGRIKEDVRKNGLVNIIKILDARSDIDRYMTEVFDVFLFPSHFEGLGIVSLEAQAAGLDVLKSKFVPNEGDVVKEAIHILPIDQGAALWVDKITELSELCLDKRNKRHIEFLGSDFTIENSANRLVNFYSDNL